MGTAFLWLCFLLTWYGILNTVLIWLSVHTFVQSIPVCSTLLQIVLDSLGCVHVTISSTFLVFLFVLSESSFHRSYSLLVHSDSDISHVHISVAYSCSSCTVYEEGLVGICLLSLCSLTEE